MGFGLLVDPGATFGVTFEVEGVYDFFCRPHEAAGMVGRIVVASGADRDSGSGRPAPTGDLATWSPEGDDRLPDAALGAFPAVEEILRRGQVRADADRR